MTSTVRKFSDILLCAALAVPAAAVSAKVVDKTVATVNGQPILLSEYLKNRDSVIEQYKKGMPEFFQQKDASAQIEKKVLDQMIDDSLLLQQAEKLKIKVRDRELENGIAEIKKRFQSDESEKPLTEDEADAAFQNELKKESINLEQFRDRIRKQLMVRRVIDESVRPRVKIPEEKEVRAYFEKINLIVKEDTSPVNGLNEEDAREMLSMGQRFKDMVSERVRVRHLLLKTDEKTSIVEKSKILKRAQDLKKQIDAGADLAELARKYSDDTESAARGGDIGYIVRGWMVPEFEKKAFSMGVGDVSEPVETKFGYHIIRIEEKKAAQKLGFEDIKDDLAQYLASVQMRKELVKYIEELRSKASIQTNLPQKSKEATQKK
ncbi:MAG: peptidylprolyl isomerase [bacterium]